MLNTCSPDHDMHSNPSNQQHGEPGGHTESSMEVDEGPINPSTPPRHITNANIPDQAIQEACEDLGRIIRPDDHNMRILLWLGVVWFLVYQALSQDPNVSPRLASEDEYRSNVKHMGEERFFDLLRDLAKTNSWRDLFKNSTFLSLFGLCAPNIILYFRHLFQATPGMVSPIRVD